VPPMWKRGRSRRWSRVVAVAVLGALLASCSSPGAPPRAQPSPGSSAVAPSSMPATAPDLAWTPCGDGFTCAVLDVPLDEDDPSRGTVPLALTRLPAADPERRIGSVVVNPGGPGLSAVDHLQATWSRVLPVVRERFDLVAFDPGGVGRSAPVRCAGTAELDRYFALDPTPDDSAELDALVRSNAGMAAACARGAGRLLGHLSTADAAADLERVREALGDERLTYVGFSYGTSLGAAYLDRFPGRVRAMVLDSAFPPSLAWEQVLAGQAGGFERALAAFLDDCERRSCDYRRQVRGDLTTAYDRLVARVDAAPLPGDGTRRVGPGALLLGVVAALYDRETGWPALAAALVSAEQGKGGPVLTLADSYLGRGPEGYANVNEANLAVNCSDRAWPDEPAAYVALSERLARKAPRFGRAVALAGLACATWPAKPDDEPREVTGEGAPPVVVVGTTRDPATPYAWSVDLADQLDSGVLVTYRGEGHTVYDVDGPPCVVEALDAYLIALEVPEQRTC
jgi:pimeloyl-ACP methyl ester carboxylesterase